MENEEPIVRYTMDELTELRARRESLTDWDRFKAITDEELEAAIDWEDEGGFEGETSFPGPSAARRQLTTVPLEGPIVAWFKTWGACKQRRMATVLRDYVDAQRTKPAPSLAGRQR